MARLEYVIEGNAAGLKKASADASASLRELEKSAEKANKAIRDEITPIGELQRAITNLNKNKLNIANAADLARQNKLIAELSAELNGLRSLGLDPVRSAAINAGRGFNSFGMELGRVVQDAPYAANNFGAIGNNITRMAELFPGYIANLRQTVVAQGQVATTGNLLKAGLGGLVSGFGGIALALSLAVTAFTIYQQIQQKAGRDAEKAARELEKQKQALDNYIATLSASARASSAAANSYGQEISKLDILFSAIKKNTDARYGNSTAINEIQRLYPEVFGSLEKQAFLTNKASEAYEKLRKSIIDTAIAEAATKLSGDAAQEQAKNMVAQLAAYEKRNKAEAEYNKIKKQALDAGLGQGGRTVDEIAQVAMAKNAYLEARAEFEKYGKAITKAKREIDSFNKVAIDAFENAAKNTPKKTGIIYQLEQQLKELQAKRPTITVQAELDLNTKQIKDVQDRLDKLGGLKGTKKAPAGAGSDSGSVFDQIRNLSQRTSNSASLAGLEGFNEQVQKVKNNYIDLFADLNSLEAELTKNTKLSAAERAKALSEISNVRKNAEKNQISELSALSITEAERVANEIQRIENESGVKAEESKAKELAAITKWYDAEVVKAKGNADILATIDAGRLAQVDAVNEKYTQKEEELWGKVQQIQEQADATSGTSAEYTTAKIKLQWDKRRDWALKYLDALIKIAEADTALNADQKSIVIGNYNRAKGQIIQSTGVAATNEINIKLSERVNRDFNNDLRRGLESFSRDFLNTIDSIGKKNYDINLKYAEKIAQAKTQEEKNAILLQKKQELSMSTGLDSIFLEFTRKLSQSLNDIVINQFIRNLVSSSFSGNKVDVAKATQRGVEKGTSGLGDEVSTGVKTAIVGAALAGAAISGISSPTNTLGQTAGGVLSGAASGAAVGTALGGPVLGTVIGGIIGGVGGLFGSKKAKEEEEKRLKEIETEQKRQTELMRQNALAYTSSIIGKMTERGVVTSVDINEFGQLTTKIDGADIVLAYERTKNNQKRGT